jgi:hypothetical protein
MRQYISEHSWSNFNVTFRHTLKPHVLLNTDHFIMLYNIIAAASVGTSTVFFLFRL